MFNGGRGIPVEAVHQGIHLSGVGVVLAPNTMVPDGKLVMCVPGKVVQDVSPEDQKRTRIAVANYIRLGHLHTTGEYPNAAREYP